MIELQFMIEKDDLKVGQLWVVLRLYCIRFNRIVLSVI